MLLHQSVVILRRSTSQSENEIPGQALTKLVVLTVPACVASELLLAISVVVGIPCCSQCYVAWSMGVRRQLMLYDEFSS